MDSSALTLRLSFVLGPRAQWSTLLRVWGLGFWGFGVLGLRVSGSGFRIWGLIRV